jgi:aminoglycoside phosphotransferase (APT) family kinase protein
MPSDTTALETLFPVDATMGDLAARFAPDVVLDPLRHHLSAAGSDANWKRCCIIGALYHPGRYIRVAYALLREDEVSDRRIWPEGQIVHLHHPVRSPVSRRGAVLEMDGLSAEIYVFPNDRRLRGVRKIAGRREALELWQHWLDRNGDGTKLLPESLRRRLIRYVPEQKWLAKMRARVTGPASAATKVKSIALRGTTPRASAVLAQRHRMLGRCLDPADGFVVPAVVGADEAQGILAVKWLRGDPLIDTLQSHDSATIMHRVATALRQWHATDVPQLPSLSTDRLRERLTESANDIKAACPDQTDATDAILGEVRHRLQRENDATSPCSTLHNDFHWNQLHFKESRIGLFDLERMARGDAWIDVANFIIQLRMLEHRADVSVPPSAPKQWADEFLGAWLALCGIRFVPARCAAYSVLSLFELARGMMRHLRPDWPALTRRCVRLAETQLNRHARENLSCD